jgi:small conductance mechanosensitive channel
MRLLLLILAVILLPLHAHAQTPFTPAQEQAEAPQPQAEVDTLIRILEDEESRTALIERLRQSAVSEQAPIEEAPTFDIVRQFSSFTDSVATGFSEMRQAAIVVADEIRKGGMATADASALAGIAIDVLVVFAAVYGSFFLLRLFVNWVERAIARRVSGRPLPLRLGGAVLAASLDLGSILLATTLGYIAALALNGAQADIEFTVDLLIAAFLFVELYKFCLRVFLQPHHAPFRIVPVSDEAAAYWSFWMNRLISLIGYTVFFVTPALAQHLSPGIGRLVEILVMGTALVLSIIIVLQSKDAVRAQLLSVAARRQQSGVVQLLRPLALYWHLLVVLYLVALFVVWLTNPADALPFMMAGTVQSAIAVGIGLVIFMFISHLAGAGLRVPNEVNQRLPLLQGRLQAFVPLVMGFVRWGVVVGVLLALAQIWLVLDVVGWAASDKGSQVLGSVLSAAMIVVVCLVLYYSVSSWVESRINSTTGKVPSAREKTLLSLFKNAFTITLVVFGIMLALAQIGVNIAPLLAGAGVVGLAIGFGAQKLVEDIITGIFIQFENVMNEGDVVEVAGKSGVVEKLTIRSVTIRDMSGTVHLIPFSSVAQVSNMVRGFSFYVSEIEVAYDSDVEAVKQAMRDAFAAVMEHDEYRQVILDDLDLQGLIAITPSSMSFRSRLKTLAGEQWGAGRYYSETLMRLFAERGIEAPTPRMRYLQAGGGQDPAVPVPFSR